MKEERTRVEFDKLNCVAIFIKFAKLYLTTISVIIILQLEL